MSHELRRRYRFEAAHYLPEAPAGHRCRRVHGHSYRVEVAIVGEVDEQRGWVVDFAEIDEVLTPLIKELDHRLLNEIDGLENPTSELLASWLFQRVVRDLPGIRAISISETADSKVIFRP